MTRPTNVEVAILRTEILELKQDILDLRNSNRRLEQFMYRFEGGKAWMFGLLAIASAIGALITQAFRFLLPHG